MTVLAPKNCLTLEQMTKSVIEMLPKALLYEELPRASVETCGAYREHDLKGARSEIQRLVNADIVALENPPLLQKIR